MSFTTSRSALSTALILPFVFGSVAWAQNPPGANPEGPNLEMLHQFATQNAAQLHKYQWIETTTATVQGHSRPAKKSSCHFDPDGTVIRTPLDSESQDSPQLKGGPLMRSIEKKKIGEIEEQMAQVREVTAMYFPLNPSKISQAVQAHQVAFEQDPAGGDTLSLRGYAKSGDRLTFTLNPTTRQVQGISVKTFLNTSSDPLTMTVQLSKLADGTIYPINTTVEVPSRKISITMVSSDFSKSFQ